MNLDDLVNSYKVKFQSLEDWYNEEYNKSFKKYFENVHFLHSRFIDRTNKITDDELESVLTQLPIDMFEVSERLNTYRLRLQCVKIDASQIKRKISKMTTKSVEDKKTELEENLASSEVVISMLDTLIQRVENEVSFCRELIMSCKKIWDGRRSAEQSNPVSESDLDKLPSCSPISSNKESEGE